MKIYIFWYHGKKYEVASSNAEYFARSFNYPFPQREINKHVTRSERSENVHLRADVRESWWENLNIHTCRIKCARENLKGKSHTCQWRFHGRIFAIVNGEFVSVAHDFLTVWGIERDRKPRYVNVADIRWIGTENRVRVYARILSYAHKCIYIYVA